MTDIPYFICVGSMKSGTTTLMYHLSNHKEIHIPTRELHFFNRDSNYNKGIEWYQNQLLEDAPNRKMIVGEKTPAYSLDENVAKRIHKDFPSVKLIWIFRNPVDRTYSNYLHAYKKGGDLLSFENALNKEKSRMKEDIYKGYKRRSIYYMHVKRYLEFFSKEQMFFMLFDELITPFSKGHVLNRLFHFLGVTEKGFNLKKQKRNKTILPRFPLTLNLQRKLGIEKNGIVFRLSKLINFYKKKPGYRKMKPEIRKELLNYFKPHNNKLSNLIGKDLSAWKQ